MTNETRRHVRTYAAIIGGSALVAIGAISAATVPSTGPDLAKSTTMTIGATSTETTPSNAPAVAEAVPKIKGPAPLPSEEESAK